MMQTVSVRHNFETGHRLPHLGGKCQSLHGHSWHVEVTVAAPALTGSGILVEFGDFKRDLRTWIDLRLDHGLMLGMDDPLAKTLAAHGKVFVFGLDAPSIGYRQFDPAQVPVEFSEGGDPHGPVPTRALPDLYWPTVENTATLLARVSTDILLTIPRAAGSRIERVYVQETDVNGASWSA